MLISILSFFTTYQANEINHLQWFKNALEVMHLDKNYQPSEYLPKIQ